MHPSLALLCDPDARLSARRAAASLLRVEEPRLDDDDKDALVQLLNEPDFELVGEVFKLLQAVDHWIVVGVAHGVLVRCRSNLSEQMPHDDGLADADLGEVVDLEDIGALVPRLAAPSTWLRAAASRLGPQRR